MLLWPASIAKASKLRVSMVMFGTYFSRYREHKHAEANGYRWRHGRRRSIVNNVLFSLCLFFMAASDISRDVHLDLTEVNGGMEDDESQHDDENPLCTCFARALRPLDILHRESRLFIQHEVEHNVEGDREAKDAVIDGLLSTSWNSDALPDLAKWRDLTKKAQVCSKLYNSSGPYFIDEERGQGPNTQVDYRTLPTLCCNDSFKRGTLSPASTLPASVVSAVSAISASLFLPALHLQIFRITTPSTTKARIAVHKATTAVRFMPSNTKLEASSTKPRYTMNTIWKPSVNNVPIPNCLISSHGQALHRQRLVICLRLVIRLLLVVRFIFALCTHEPVSQKHYTTSKCRDSEEGQEPSLEEKEPFQEEGANGDDEAKNSAEEGDKAVEAEGVTVGVTAVVVLERDILMRKAVACRQRYGFVDVQVQMTQRQYRGGHRHAV
ncbi:hypothetical protein DOTSEDRAFT_36050 [Dothistroma septosporum NZE10]|uniref:Uncharacterized protein n=1 Tax=Dothistroma septosporum (strain NZE10 / CBS 128990) TaxID=675120 RepID=N1PKN7_DOTSN|nr:hypothetical protein DOTSEDRAFT_36050 [Dothistroma septosporum NZE10]